MRKTSAVVGGLVIALAMALLAGPAGAVTLPNVVRVAGNDRYETAKEISEGFGPNVPVTFIATGANYPDALAGGAAAVKKSGNILLVQQNQIPAITEAALGALNPQQIIVLGGTGVIHDDIVAKLDTMTPGTATRIAGADRYLTAVELSKAIFPANVSDVYVATGTNYPDALAGSAAAGSKGGPVLLIPPTGLTQPIKDELTRLSPGRIVVLGGTSAVSDALKNELGTYADGGNVVRIAGLTRYSTSAQVSEDAFPAATNHAYLATGQNFPDALAISPAAGALDRPVLLVQKDCIPGSVADELERLTLTGVTVVGGTGVIAPAVENGFECLDLGL